MADNLEPIPILTEDEVVQTAQETVQTPEDTPPDIAADDDLVPPERNLPSTDVDA
jgi:hypothetical protein